MSNTKNTFLVFFGSILLLVFVTLPLFQSFLSERYILIKKEEKLVKEGEYIEKIRQIDQELFRYSSQLELIDQAISDEPAIPSLIRHIEESSQSHGIFFRSIGSFSAVPSRNFPGIRETTLNFSISGAYGDFKRFLRALEMSGKIINVESFVVSPVTEEEEGDVIVERDVLSFEVSIRTYSH